jgi:dTDP-4-amino-4,6-dideoxygalactose transaminase
MSDPAFRRIDQCDPLAGYLAQREDIDAAIARVLGNGRYVLGPETEAFEREFAAFVGVRHGVGVANGTDALALALQAIGISAGDAVISVAHTAVATTAAIRQAGANPVFVDIEPRSGLMDPASLEEVLLLASATDMQLPAGRLRAIVPVHLYGRCVDMARVLQLADRYGLAVVEDCAQAHGAAIGKTKAGAFGAVAAFSFYPTKNLGALGDGGAIVSDNDAIAAQLRLLREYGWKQRYVSTCEGRNSRLDELQAAVLRVKMSRLDEQNQRRREIARRYRQELGDASIILPEPADDAGHVYHQFAIRSGERDALRRFLDADGIGTLIHYPMPIHRQPAYQDPRLAPLPLPVTEAFAASVLSLPMYPQLAAGHVERVIDRLKAWSRR